MDRIQYTYTVGLDDEAVEERLRESETGVLALAAADDAYAIPVAHNYEDGALYVRLAVDDASTKREYLESTDTTCYTVYDVDTADESWSIVVTGSLGRLTGEDRKAFDPATINEAFLDLRLFGEDVEAVDVAICELEIETITGRTT